LDLVGEATGEIGGDGSGNTSGDDIHIFKDSEVKMK